MALIAPPGRFIGWRRRYSRPIWCGIVSGDTQAIAERRLLDAIRVERGSGEIAVTLGGDLEPDQGRQVVIREYEFGRVLSPGGRGSRDIGHLQPAGTR